MGFFILARFFSFFSGFMGRNLSFQWRQKGLGKIGLNEVSFAIFTDLRIFLFFVLILGFGIGETNALIKMG